VELPDKIAEAAARIVDLARFLIAACKECLIQAHRLRRIRRQAFRESFFDGVEVADEGEAGVVRDEITSW
jgi:hypothetical protein